MSPADRRAALALLGLLLVGAAVRVLVRDGAAGAVAYHWAAERRPTRDSVAARAARAARPLARGETIDVNAATAEELTRLPRIGPQLALRIVAHREANGAFASLAALGSVPGIGPATLEGLRPYVSFGSVLANARPSRAGDWTAAQQREPWWRAGAGPRSLAPAVIRLNTATEDELATLPGIGPERARAIVEDRARHGPYRALDELTRVPGIGAATVRRLTGRVRVP